MTRKDLEDRLRDIVAKRLKLDAPAISANASFMDELGADSVDVVELLMDFQEAFGVTIPDADAEGLGRFDLALDYLAAKLRL